ncbi:glutamate receptor ionotropic, kainate 2-like [Tribolium madens]|uniref:glutamate receptor ionotropic, kainate 2-like n=1 Tax=Tribolium madens TaxID=41895 RepID=UPI001CF766AF|nr:glutamate receptor ionotropic, kainate 2-like [Tribolium madens]
MKIAYQNVIWWFFFAVYNYMSLAQDEPLNVDVVGFFDEKNGLSEIAFQTAISNLNTMKDEIRFNPMSFVVNTTDSFENSKSLCDIVETSNVGGVFCPTSAKIAPIVESVGDNLNIPAIQVGWRPSATYTDILVNVYPVPTLLFQGLRAIVRNLQWRSIVVFYETAENLIRLQDILKTQDYNSGNKYNSLMLKELGPGPDYRSALKQIQNKSEYRIILDCKTENIVPILRQAKELKLLEPHFSYFLTSLDAHTVDLKVLNSSVNVTTVRIFEPESDNFKTAISNWNNYMKKMNIPGVGLDPYSVKTETALMHDSVHMFLKCITDLHATGKSVEPTKLSCENVDDKWVPGFDIASFMKAYTHETEGLYSITTPMKFDHLGRRTNFSIFVVEGNRDDVVAKWNPSDPDVLQFFKSEEDRNKELERKWSEGIVTVASILGPPYLMKKKPKSETDLLEGNNRYEGFSMDLIALLAKDLNIKFKFEVLESGQRGAYDKATKSWNGLVREILDRRAELAICDLTITPERREVVDFSTPFMRLGISILYKKAEAKEANMYAFLDPFSVKLWLYSATLYLGITVVLFFISRISPQDWENPHPCEQEPEELENIWDMKNCLWLTLGSIMNQGCDILPKGLAPRMAASMWWFFSIIVTNSYMANLAAFLTNERSQASINSAEDLAKQTKIKYGTLEGGSTQNFFRDSNYSLYQRMWTSMEQSKPSVFEKSNDDGVARVQNTKNRLYAFLMESSTLEYQIMTKCDLKQVGNWLDSKGYGIAMPLDYPHRSRINEALLRMQEKGEINRLKDKWWKEKRSEPPCPKEAEDQDANKLALQNVGGVFIVLGVGLALAYIVGILEFLWNVRSVSVDEHISYMQALKVELMFALDVRKTKKRAKPAVSESSSSSRSPSMARSFLQSAGSFLRLDKINQLETPGSSRHTSRPLE